MSNRLCGLVAYVLKPPALANRALAKVAPGVAAHPAATWRRCVDQLPDLFVGFGASRPTTRGAFSLAEPDRLDVLRCLPYRTSIHMLNVQEPARSGLIDDNENIAPLEAKGCMRCRPMRSLSFSFLGPVGRRVVAAQN